MSLKMLDGQCRLSGILFLLVALPQNHVVKAWEVTPFWLFRVNHAIANYFYLVHAAFAFAVAIIKLKPEYRYVNLPFSCNVLLQQWHLENSVNSLLVKKFELVDLFYHQMQDLEVSEKLCLELLIPLGFNVFVVWQNFITQSIAFWFCSLIISSFLEFLSGL